MPLLRAGDEPRSATMAVERLTFPLLMPPIILETRKAAKLFEAAHTAYEVAKPACLRAGTKGRHGHLRPGGAHRVASKPKQYPGTLPCSGAPKGHLCSQCPRGRSSSGTASLSHRSHCPPEHHPQGATRGRGGPTAASPEGRWWAGRGSHLWAPVPGTAAAPGASPGSQRRPP